MVPAAAPVPIQLERRRRCHVVIHVPGADELPAGELRAAMADYLSDPGRALRFLLNRDKLTRAADGRFHYRSSSLRLLRWRFEPEVIFAADWQNQALAIRFEECRLQGLGDLSQLVDFGFEASITPADDGLEASGKARLMLQRRGALRLMPEALVENLANKVLRKVLKRMDKRCRQGLRQGACRWLHRQIA
ncbi:MAG: DUF1997 domain-containing protein [Cyanobacteriota bacterium]